MSSAGAEISFSVRNEIYMLNLMLLLNIIDQKVFFTWKNFVFSSQIKFFIRKCYYLYK